MLLSDRDIVKRHPSLVPLSLEHHDALVLAQGLILGRSKAPRSDWPTDHRSQVDKIKSFFQETFLAHFDAEEKHLFPRVAERIPARTALVEELRKDHDDLRRLVRELSAGCSSELSVRLPRLGRLMEVHIRKEERVLFQAIQSDLEAVELEEIGVNIKAHLTGPRHCLLDDY